MIRINNNIIKIFKDSPVLWVGVLVLHSFEIPGVVGSHYYYFIPLRIKLILFYNDSVDFVLSQQEIN